MQAELVEPAGEDEDLGGRAYACMFVHVSAGSLSHPHARVCRARQRRESKDMGERAGCADVSMHNQSGRSNYVLRPYLSA